MTDPRSACTNAAAPFLAALVLVAVLLPVVAGAAAPSYPSPASVKRQALKDVEQRLQLAVPPPGSRRVGEAPKSAHLEGPGMYGITPNLIDRGRVWSVPGSRPQTLAWIREHPPAGLAVSLEGSSGTRGHFVLHEIGFEWGELQGVSIERSLLFTAARSQGRTYLRADSQAIWIAPHPASAVVPATARTLSVELKRSDGTVRRKSISSLAKVREVAATIDQLPAVQPGRFECGPGFGAEEVTLVFRDGGGAIVAEALQESVGSWCGVLKLTIEGKRQPPLEAELATLEAVPGLLP